MTPPNAGHSSHSEKLSSPIQVNGSGIKLTYPEFWKLLTVIVIIITGAILFWNKLSNSATKQDIADKDRVHAQLFAQDSLMQSQYKRGMEEIHDKLAINDVKNDLILDRLNVPREVVNRAIAAAKLKSLNQQN
jgi:hypothetical protein